MTADSSNKSSIISLSPLLVWLLFTNILYLVLSRMTRQSLKSDDKCRGSWQWWKPSDREASAVRTYLQNARWPTAKIIGVRDGGRCQDDPYGDGSTTFWCVAVNTKQWWWPWTETTGRGSWLAPTVLAYHGSGGGGGYSINNLALW